MPVITIDKRNFFKGQSTSSYTSDGGFSPDSTVEVLRQSSSFPFLTWGRVATEYSTNISDYVYGTTVGYRSGIKRYSISSGGKLYETNPTDNTHTLKYTESVKTYSSGISNVAVFKNKIYVTSTTDIYRENYSFSENDADWWTATLSKTALTATVPHILFEFNDLLYVTNGNKVWATDGTTGYTTGSNTLTLTDDWVINQVLIGNSEIYLFAYFKGYSSATLDNVPCKIFIWDGYSESWVREILLSTGIVLSTTVTTTGMFFSSYRSIYNFDGYNYIPVVTNLNGVEQLTSRRDNIFFSAGAEIYKYNTTYKATSKLVTLSYNVQFLFVDYSDIIHAFAIDQGNTKSRFYQINSNTGITSFYTNFYEFERPVYLRKVEVVFSANTVTNTSYSLYIRDELDNELQQIQITNVGIRKFTKIINHQVDACRLQLYSGHADNKFVRWIKLYYEPSERTNIK